MFCSDNVFVNKNNDLCEKNVQKYVVGDVFLTLFKEMCIYINKIIFLEDYFEYC